MEALPLRAGRANCTSNLQQDMIEQTLAILASMMQQAAHDATLYFVSVEICLCQALSDGKLQLQRAPA